MLCYDYLTKTFYCYLILATSLLLSGYCENDEKKQHSPSVSLQTTTDEDNV